MLIGDGVSSNLTMFKQLTGYEGQYSLDSSKADPHYVRPYFKSPFTGENIYIIICPSHMVCLLIMPMVYNTIIIVA